MLTIWGRLNSHNVKKIAWFAEELGIDYLRRDVGGAFGMDAAYRALNPNALIPTIEDDGLILWESNAILRYLASRYAAGTPFWPNSPAARARGDKWMDWQFSYADAQRGAFVNLVRRAPADRIATEIAASATACARMMTLLDTALAETGWLSGDAFGLGDVPMGVYAHSWFTLAIDRPHLGNVAAWYGRLSKRPGYASTVMIPLT